MEEKPHDNLSPTERDFLAVIPEAYKFGALSAYKDYRKTANFSSIFERSKLCTAWMTGFVTATHFVRKEDEKPATREEIVPEIPGN